eukprot:gene6210-10216_t
MVKKKKDDLKSTIINNFTLPPLPSIDNIDPNIYKGPNEYCNWVIPNALLVGAYPRRKNLETILPLEITKFICLMEEHEIKRYGDYFNFNVLKTAKNPKLYSFEHVPIKDHSVLVDEEAMELVTKIINWLNNGEKIYLHCLGGHGRTGTIVSLLLFRLYKLDAYNAMEFCQKFHDSRGKTKNLKSPESSEQRNQLYRIAIIEE